MASKVAGLIEISGLADQYPSNPKHFKQLSIQEDVIIPEEKPDAEQIVTVSANVVITNTCVIKTPVALSYEGQKLTGFKLIVEGKVCQQIEYVADEPTQSVHAAHFAVPFSAFIVLPSDYPPGTPVTVTGYIEDIFVELLCKRSIFKNITVLLDARY